MSRKSSSPSSKARFGAIGFTLMAVLLALVSAFLLARLMKGRGYDRDSLQKIVVAKNKLNPGARISSDQLQMKLWPKKSIPEGAFLSLKKLLASDKKVPLQTIMAGEPIISGRLSHPKKGSGMAPLVPKNLRAFPVKIDRWVAASRMLYPGAFVDVMGTVKLETQGYTSRLILQGVKVLAVNGAVDGVSFTRNAGKKKKRNVRRSISVATLLLTPEQSEELALATRIGKIDFVLRGASDGQNVDTEGVTLSKLFRVPVAEEVDEEEEPVVLAKPERRAERKRSSRTSRRARQLKRRPIRSRRSARKQPSKPAVVTVGGAE